MSILGKRLRHARTVNGLSQSQLAERIGSSSAMISSMENGRCRLSLPKLTTAAWTLGVSVDYLIGLVDGPPPTPTGSGTRTCDLEDWQAGAVVSHADDSVDDSKPAHAGDGGTILDNARSVGVFKFRRTWFANCGLEPRHCCVIKVASESMEPTLFKGSSILIDRASLRRRAERIYVIQTDGRLMIARARSDRKGAWQLVRDHPDKLAWPTLPWPSDARIVGEVRWSAQTFGEKTAPRTQTPATRPLVSPPMARP